MPDNSPASTLPLIAIDGDGVLVDYHTGYARAWKNAFGSYPKVRNPKAWKAHEYWDVPQLTREERDYFYEVGFTDEVWRNLPAMPGAVEACAILRDAGYHLVCVTALESKHKVARAANFQELGFGIREVFAVGTWPEGNPKASVLNELQPVAFVDDAMPYLQGLPLHTWSALVHHQVDHNPNFTQDWLRKPDSVHTSLLDFAKHWVSVAQHWERDSVARLRAGSGLAP